MIKFRLLIISIALFYSFNLLCQHTAPFDTLSPDSAIVYYKSMLSRNKKSSFAYFGLASAHFEKNNFKAVLKISKNNLNHSNDFQAGSYLLHASALDRLGRIDKAIKEYERALKIFPKDYKLWYQYAISCYKYREHEKSLKALKNAIELQPLFVQAHYLYGCTLLENNNDKACVSAFLFALLLDNDSVRSRQAITFIKKYLTHQPEFINIPFFEKRLKISTVDNILLDYSPDKITSGLYKDIEPNLLANEINIYLSSTKDYKTQVYGDFYKSLETLGMTNVFSYYILRTSHSPYITEWYKLHSAELRKLASFMEQNLPGK